MFGLDLIPTKVYQGLVIALTIASALLFIQTKMLQADVATAERETAKTISKHNLLVADMEKDLRISNEKSADLSLKLSTTVRTLEAKQNDEVNKIRVASNAVIATLQLRASRATQATGKPGEADSCSGTTANRTGLTLSREDSEFLVREATRADEQREALRTCYGAWDSVLKAILDFNSSTADVK